MSNNDYKKPDFYSQKAKDNGFLARSVYKLEEIDQKYNIFQRNNSVLDLGAYPGSWSQYALKKIGKKGKIIAIDLQNLTQIQAENYFFIHGDIEKNDTIITSYAPYDIVMSDMAPNTSGVKSEDAFLSHELSSMALEIAYKNLKKNGIFVCKIFQGGEIDDFYFTLKKYFKKFKSIKPQAVRKNSKEIYVIAWYKKS